MSGTAPNQFNQQEVSSQAYQAIRDFIYQEAGIDLGAARHMLVGARLNKRLRHHQLNSLDEYVHLLRDQRNFNERQIAIDLLTTNETYFFREAEHFEVLKDQMLARHPEERLFRLWSAACSSGEEAYSIGMVLDDFFGERVKWEIFGSDISSRIVEKAKRGLYQAHRIDAIPEAYLQKYCLMGAGDNEGFLQVDSKVRDKTRFAEINLIKPLPDVGIFDAIFLRNVLIYFDGSTKEKIVRNLITKLRTGGMLFIGHSESLKSFDIPLELVAHTSYRKNRVSS